jgi:hypothetical protein
MATTIWAYEFRKVIKLFFCDKSGRKYNILDRNVVKNLEGKIPNLEVILG